MLLAPRGDAAEVVRLGGDAAGGVEERLEEDRRERVVVPVEHLDRALKVVEREQHDEVGDALRYRPRLGHHLERLLAEMVDREVGRS